MFGEREDASASIVEILRKEMEQAISRGVEACKISDIVHLAFSGSVPFLFSILQYMTIFQDVLDI